MRFFEILVTRPGRFFRRVFGAEATTGLFLAVVVGVAAGLGAVGFRWLIRGFQWVFFKQGADWLGFLGDYYVIILPVVGGLLVGILIYFIAREVRGEGPPEVMRAVAIGGGRIRSRVGLVEILASSICIGSGGSVGREGPIVQIGASFGSAVGQRLHLPDGWLRTLALCGAAAGVSATFNAPIGGVFFALEVISHRVVTPRLFNVMLSALTAEYVAWAFLGPRPSFIVEEYTLGSYWEILAYILLGIFAGLLAVAFVRFFYKVEDIFDRIKMPMYLKPALGGLAVGIMGFFYTGVFGVGYGSEYAPGGAFVESGAVDAMLAGQIAIGVLIALLFLKMIATSVTLGSGGSGGVFAPSLFVGAALGGVFGMVAGRLFPEFISMSGAYSLVGMGAFFAAVVQGPITAIVLLLEMTRDIELLLPLMTAVVVATLTARAFTAESIYTLRLKRWNVDLRQRERLPAMRRIRVAEAMTRNFPTVSPKMPVQDLIAQLSRTGHHGFPVADEDGRLYGVVTWADVEARMVGDSTDLKVEDIATKSPIVAYPDQTLYEVLLKLGATDVGRIPVVDRDNPKKLLGVLRRHDIIRAYQRKITEVPQT